MRMPSKYVIESLRQHFQKGSRVRLNFMDDPYSKLREGDLGTVICVDDMGTIHIAWDCGSSLGVVYGVDSCSKI